MSRLLIAALACLCLFPTLVIAQPKLKVHDERVKISVFAEHPQIVTPTGIAVTSKGDVLVVECHTHFPPAGYLGPKTDRIKLLKDTDGNGVADQITIFSSGTVHTMNVAVHPVDDSVYVATRASILRMADTNGNGRADQQKRIVFLKTKGTYPHNGLSGFAFGHDGRVYFGLGENLGASYELIGSDRRLRGGGEGGNIYSCKPDGRDLKRVATGFWNPFHLCFDGFGNLFTVDNDPDSRPPCRLLHIVPGGDYGYRFRNGRRGIHPFTAWDGELPGTLPMSAGTGEAPSGMTVYDSTMLPRKYRGRLLVTSWGEHRLESFQMKPQGGTLRGEMTPLISGGENFRPVGVVVAPDGSIFLSDWVDRSYKLHSKGRIWRITAKLTTQQRLQQGAFSQNRIVRETAGRKLVEKKQFVDLYSAALRSSDTLVRATSVGMLQHDPFNTLVGIATTDKDVRVRAMAIRFGRPDASDLRKFAKVNQPGLVRAAALRRMADKKFSAALMKAAGDADPFIRQAARRSILRAKLEVRTLLNSVLTAQRESAALIIRERGSVRELPSLLSDPSEVVKQIAIQWIGESRIAQHRSTVEAELSQASSRLLFESCLASLELLSGARRNGSKDEWDGRQYAFNLLNQSGTSERVRVQILRTLGDNYAKLTVRKLAGMLSKARDPQLQLEVVKSLRGTASPRARNNELLRIAQDSKYSIRVRAESLVGYQVSDGKDLGRIAKLAVNAPDEDVAMEALRSMRLAGKDRRSGPSLEVVKKALKSKSKQWQAMANRVLNVTTKTTYPASMALVMQKLDERPGNPKVGARIFFNKQIGRCSTCHESRGRGGRIGPDLTQIGRTMTRQRLVESILYPSREIAPRYVPWTVVREDGRTFSGMYLGHDNKDRHSYADTDGKLHQIPIREIARRLQMKKSIMPDGLVANLTLQEFRDLLAYLRASQ